MREMSVEMATLLKSKTMVGDNKPTAEVLVGGGGYNFPSTIGNTWVRPSTTYTKNSLSVAKKANGKIIICNMVGSTIYEAEADTIEDLITGDNGATNWQSTGIAGVGNYCWATVWNLDGGLYLTFSDNGQVNGASNAKQLIYESPSGNGGDWVLYSTIQSLDTTGLTTRDNFASEYNLTGIPIALDNGDWVMLNGRWQAYSDHLSHRLYFWKSTDNGLTWTHGKNFTAYAGAGTYYESFNKKIVDVDGVLYTMYSEAWGSVPVEIWKSTDSGANWTMVFQQDGATWWDNLYYEFSLFLLNGELHMVALHPGTDTDQGEIFRFSDLSDLTLQESIVSIPTSGTKTSTRDHIFSLFIDTHMVIAAEEYLLGFELSENKLQPISIQISRTKGMAGQLTVELDNKDAILAPDGTANPQLLWPNKEIVVKQGYGAEMLTTFTGLIDSISMSRDSSVASISVSARDKMKALLDHYVRDSSFNYTITYENMSVEAIWQDLITKAGLTSGTVESTGILLTEKTFSWESYADAISWLDEISGFETYCDEDGTLHFVWDGRPESVSTAYTFVEGVDLITLGYEIDDKDLYYSVAVYGKAADDSVIYYAAQLPQAGYWNIPSGKVMRIDAPDADTQEKCQAIADKAIYLMQTRARRVMFETIGIPHLQRGDFIQVTESSTTISEIYRITDISTTQSNGQYTMTLSCYYHAAPEVEE